VTEITREQPMYTELELEQPEERPSNESNRAYRPRMTTALLGTAWTREEANSKLGLCIWLRSPRQGLLDAVTEALARRWTQSTAVIELIPPAPQEHTDESETARVDEDRNTRILLGLAAILVQEGSTVLVKSPTTEVGPSVSNSVIRIVEVLISPDPDRRGSSGIPVIYRCIESGQVVERELPAIAGLPANRPGVVLVDGGRGLPEEIAATIEDVLQRAGWTRRTLDSLAPKGLEPVTPDAVGCAMPVFSR
jgi:hypothetical protein